MGIFAKHVRSIALLPLVCTVMLCIAFFVLAINAQAAQLVTIQTPSLNDSAIIYEAAIEDRDFSFIDSLLRGANKAHHDVGVQFREYRVQDGTNVETIRKAIEDGNSHIVAVGYQNVLPVMTLAKDYPHVRFTVIDGVIQPRLFSNVRSIAFKDHEGAFLVGMVAAYISHSKKIGFIGGMDIPLITNFAVGFHQGAAYAQPGTVLLREYVGTTALAWNNPERARILARKLFNQGAEIIFAPAGGSSVGALQAADEMGRFAIGVDSNQNGLYPGSVLTSMVKRVDLVIYDVLVDNYSGKWEPGLTYLGIKEGALDYAIDVHNRSLISRDIIEKIESAKDEITRGNLVVESKLQ